MTEDEGADRAYGTEIYARLAAIKAPYDPSNVFRVDHNIPPLVTRSAMTAIQEKAPMCALAPAALVRWGELLVCSRLRRPPDSARPREREHSCQRRLDV